MTSRTKVFIGGIVVGTVVGMFLESFIIVNFLIN